MWLNAVFINLGFISPDKFMSDDIEFTDTLLFPGCYLFWRRCKTISKALGLQQTTVRATVYKNTGNSEISQQWSDPNYSKSKQWLIQMKNPEPRCWDWTIQKRLGTTDIQGRAPGRKPLLELFALLLHSHAVNLNTNILIAVQSSS